MATGNEEWDSATPVDLSIAWNESKPASSSKQPSLTDPGFMRSRMGINPGEPMALNLGKAIGKAAYETGGKVTDWLANMGASPSVAAGAGALANAGVESIPTLAGGLVGRSFTPAFDWAGKRLMQSAMKPPRELMRSPATTSLPTASTTTNPVLDAIGVPNTVPRFTKADQAIQTMLDEGINPTRGGLDVLRGKIDDLSSQVSDVLKNYSGRTISKYDVGATLQPVIARIEATNPTPNVARAAVEDIYTEFMKNGLIPKNIPVEQAQTLKQGIYKAIGDRKYNLMPYSVTESAQTAANKALGSGFRAGLEKAVPDVIPLNAQQGLLINALKASEPHAMSASNANPLNIAPFAHNPFTWATYMADKNSLIKSLIARGLYSGQEVLPVAAGATAGALASPQNRGALSKNNQ